MHSNLPHTARRTFHKQERRTERVMGRITQRLKKYVSNHRHEQRQPKGTHHTSRAAPYGTACMASDHEQRARQRFHAGAMTLAVARNAGTGAPACSVTAPGNGS
jgi:hypothetical protein